MTIAQQLESLQKAISEVEREKIQAETRLESLAKQKQDIFDKCKDLEVNPNELPQEVERLLEDLSQGMQEIERLLSNTKEENVTTSSKVDDIPW